MGMLGPGAWQALARDASEWVGTARGSLQTLRTDTARAHRTDFEAAAQWRIPRLGRHCERQAAETSSG